MHRQEEKRGREGQGRREKESCGHQCDALTLVHTAQETERKNKNIKQQYTYIEYYVALFLSVLCSISLEVRWFDRALKYFPNACF